MVHNSVYLSERASECVTMQTCTPGLGGRVQHSLQQGVHMLEHPLNHCTTGLLPTFSVLMLGCVGMGPVQGVAGFNITKSSLLQTCRRLKYYGHCPQSI